MPTSSEIPESQKPPDFTSLRQEGIQLLERMAGQVWTDFNTHDPGVTILEQACYALTDLNYRIGYDVKDLLASSAPETEAGPLFTPAKVLTTNPVTLADLRRVALDVPGVRNAWVEPVADPEPAIYHDPSEKTLGFEAARRRRPSAIRGLYRVLIASEQATPDPARDAELIGMVQRRLLACRNLAEDFERPQILERKPVDIQAQVEIGEVTDPEQLLAEINHALSRIIAPRVRFRTLAELLAEGRPVDEILEGPPLDHGFLEADQLEKCQRPTALRASDLIHAIMEVPGVRAVNELNLTLGNSTSSWYVELDPQAPEPGVLVLSAATITQSLVQLTRGRVVARTNPERVMELYHRLESATTRPNSAENPRDLPVPTGRDRRVESYRSIQHQFPAAYGIGEAGLPSSASVERQAQARQLKAYLCLFDQLLASAFSQVARVGELFSPIPGEPRTYFTQPLAGIPGVEGIIQADLQNADRLGGMLESLEQACYRRQRFLNHLLARFGEEFLDYSLLPGAPQAQAESMVPILGQSLFELVRAARLKDLVRSMSAFVADIPQIGAERFRAFDYSLPAWDEKNGSENVSGLERRLGRKLGFLTCRRRPLADLPKGDAGGFHLVEHILLRPRTIESAAPPVGAGLPVWDSVFLADPERPDPYSGQLSFVFPNWLTRFEDKLDPSYRNFLTKTVREETPAHLHVQMHWLDRDSMRTFEAAYRDYLTSLATSISWNSPS
ncbi:MAG TPA: hypothetical protein PLX89_20925 [Verrucomicrobiota bacterium]|nr:hypothetical protein [Verrucomicrobiota bacterium]